MKNVDILSITGSVSRYLTLVLITLVMAGSSLSYAQVNFVQTLNADFNKGILSNAVVGSDNVYLQNAATDVGTWLTTTVLPQTLAGHKAVSWNNRFVYLVGGYNDLNYVSTVYRATIQSGGITSWTALAPLPVALRDPAVVIGANTIYVLGGRNATQVFNTIYYADLYPDGSMGVWQTSAVTLPVNLWGHTATYLMGHIYVTGGTSSLTESTAINNVYYSRVQALNTLSAFSAGTSLPAARNRHATVTYNNKLYVLGGYDNAGTKSNTVYIATPALNGSTGAWSSGTNLPVAISNHSAAMTNGVIMVLAGAVGATLSNTVYYANADAGVLTWNTSPNLMYDFTKDGAAFEGNGLIFYTGGANLSGTPILNCRYANMNTTANYVLHGVFVSNPFYELGAERLINQIAFNKTATAPAKVEVQYRLAGSNGIWGDWTALTTTSPVAVSQTKQYLQYAVVLTGTTTLNATLHDMTLTTPGTQLSGNLNATTTFTKALSPYWATSDISFTAGTHTFQAGAQVLFLPETGLSIGQANVICNGTAVDSVKFLYFTSNETGKWDGITFDDNSDNGVSSQFYYTVIGNAGFGSNNANLFCDNSNEPLLNNCQIRNADGNGIRLNNAHISIQNSTIRINTENGLYLNSSNPNLVNCTVTANAGAGVYFTSNVSEPTYSGTTISNNTYALHYPSPNYTLYQPNGNPTLTGNTYNGLCLDGGSISGANKWWNTITYDYILLGNTEIGEYAGVTRLTIEPGNTIKMVSGSQLRIGTTYPYSGDLYAIGTADSLITFTSHNGLAGGWNGIYFGVYSDDWGGQSQLDYCVIEKGNDYNLYSNTTSQPNLMNHTKIQNAVLDGARFENVTTSNITNCQFLNNGRYPLYFMTPSVNVTHSANTFTGNLFNRIVLHGGNYYASRTLTLDGVPYYALNSIIVGEYTGNPRLTIEPGVTIDFATGTKLQVGGGYPYSGELYAVGTSGSGIILRAYTLATGGWDGVHFTQYNDDWAGCVSTMDYVTIRHGAVQNLLIEGSNQPTINNCQFRLAGQHGLVLSSSNIVVDNCQFVSNGGYPIKLNNWDCNLYNHNNTFTTNGMQYIALSGGDYGASRTYNFDNVPYHVLNDIYIQEYTTPITLTLQPGVTLLFDPGKRLQLGGGYPFTGGLIAEGKADSLISFKPFNNLAGGWAGINFTQYSDEWGGTSSMKYCRVEKGALYNISCDGTTMPVMQNCTLMQSTGDGLKVTGNSNLTVSNTTITYNTGNGISLDNTSDMTLGNGSSFTCNIYNNGPYELYNNSTADIDARYNYWGTGDSTMVAARIYDKADNGAKGRVYFYPFAGVPSMTTPTTILGGTVKYANTGASPMKTAAMVIKDFGGTTIASTTTNTSGVYGFTAFTSGNYPMTITPSDVWAGVNSTDALAILNHFANITLLSGMKLAAADVNVSHTINGTDALFVMKRYSGMISSFPAGNSLWHSDTVIVSGSNVTNNIDMIWFGDVNASWTPPAKESSSVGIVYEGSQLVTSFEEFSFPVRVKNSMEIGAISLGFYYPEEYLEIMGAELGNGVSGFSWTASDGLFRMGWCDMNPIIADDDEVVVILKMKAKDLSGLTTGIALELYESCEFADAAANPNSPSVVSVPVINTTLTGVGISLQPFGFQVYPNPLNGNSAALFTLEEECHVTLSVVSHTGNEVNGVTNGTFAPGSHRISLSEMNLAPGVYLLKATFKSPDQSSTGIVKVVVSR